MRTAIVDARQANGGWLAGVDGKWHPGLGGPAHAPVSCPRQVADVRLRPDAVIDAALQAAGYWTVSGTVTVPVVLPEVPVTVTV